MYTYKPLLTAMSVQSRVTDFFQQKKASKVDKNKSSNAVESETAQKSNARSPLKLNAAQVRHRLGKVRNLAELRQRLSDFSDTASRLNKERDQVQLQVQAVERAAHETSPVKPQQSETTLEAAEQKLSTPDDNQSIVPAYERYAHLVSVNVNLEMPIKYKLLLDTFRASEQVMSIMYNRNEMITFEKLKAGVQRMTRKNFKTDHLGQISTVYQEAYKYEQLKLSSKFSNDNPGMDKYCLTITPNVNTDLKNYEIKSPTKTPVKRRLNLGDDLTPPPCSPLKISHFKSLSPVAKNSSQQQNNRQKPMSGARLICRAEIFRKNLYKILNTEHKKFFSSLTPPIEMTVDEENALKRWHPEFPLNNLPDIVCTLLPTPPSTSKIYSAKEMLRQTTSNVRLPARITDALKAAAEKADKKYGQEIKQMKEKCLVGIPASVLEKIRAKECLKQQRIMRSSCEDEQKIQCLQSLPDMMRIIKGFYALENKNSLPHDAVCKKLKDSYSKSSVSQADIERRLDMIIQLAPDWLTKTKLQSKGMYLRMDRNVNTNDVTLKIERMITKAV